MHICRRMMDEREDIPLLDARGTDGTTVRPVDGLLALGELSVCASQYCHLCALAD
jgi:hypothetical protein